MSPAIEQWPDQGAFPVTAVTMITNNNGRLKPFVQPVTIRGKKQENHIELQIPLMPWCRSRRDFRGFISWGIWRDSPPTYSCLWTSTGQPRASHTASQCGSLAALSGTGKVPITLLEDQGGSLVPRNKGPSQDLLHEERLNIPDTQHTPNTSCSIHPIKYGKLYRTLPAQPDCATASITEL